MSRKRKSTPTPPAPTRRARRTDGYRNALTGIGGRNDPKSYTTFCADILSNAECRELYRGSDIAKKVVEYKVKAAFRSGFKIKLQDKILAEDISADLEDLKVRAAFRQAGFWENAYGGAAIYPVINDGGNLSQPLRGGRMLRIENLVVLEAQELIPVSYYRSLYDRTGSGESGLGRPMRYRFEPRSPSGSVTERGQLIHESRLIIFPGVRVSRDQASVNHGWGDSALNRPHRVIQQFDMTWEGVATLMHRIEQGVLKMKQLTDNMGTDGTDKIAEGLIELNRLRNLLDMLVIDGEDEYERLGVPLTGVSDTLEKFMLRLSAACEMPAAFLVGMSPTGLNSTGDAETRSWYDSVDEERADHFGPRVEQLVGMYMRTNEAPTRGKEPDVWSVEWPSLWQPTEKERAETNETQSRADKTYHEIGLPAPIIFRNRFGGDTSSLDTTITDQELADLENLAAGPTPEEIAAAAALAGAPAPVPVSGSAIPNPGAPVSGA